MRLRFNHPKNYVGVPLAISAAHDTHRLIETHLVADTTAALQGAAELNLITTPTEDDPVALTGLGQRVVETVTSDRHATAALEALGRLQGSTGRFVESGSRYWEPLLTTVYQAYQPAEDLISLVASTGPVSLAELAQTAHTTAPATEAILLQDPPLSPIGQQEPLAGTVLAHPDVYYSPVTCQLKSQLWHAGILTERGVHTGALAPLSDRWAVEPRHLTSTTTAHGTGGDR